MIKLDAVDLQLHFKQDYSTASSYEFRKICTFFTEHHRSSASNLAVLVGKMASETVNYDTEIKTNLFEPEV